MRNRTRLSCPTALRCAAVFTTLVASALAALSVHAGAAPSADFWSFQPLRTAAPPAVRNGAWAANPVDRFILAKLEAHGITPAPAADRRTLIRRITFDLIGLPPTPAEIDAFLTDKRPNAYETLVDRLLASPHYGERWGRHWLDLARYADSDGFEPDRDRLYAYAYRDWVIRALNADMPFDRFARRQLAADEEAPGNPTAWAATGFCTAGPHSIFTLANEGTPQERAQLRYDELDDMLATTGATFLGLTVGCARCHDHKFDPIPTRDYYRMLAAFTMTERVERLLVTPEEEARCRAQHIEPPQGLGLTERGPTPEVSYLLARGDPQHKVEPVTFGVLSVLAPNGPPKVLRPAGARTTYQRLALARWLTDVAQGAGRLTARVIVNRLWQHHFGDGLVRTPNDFGSMGERPTHPELLDWLANALIRNGWRLKPIHRLLVTSQVYREGAAYDPEKAKADPEDRLLWHRRPLRLEAEAVRDTILAVSGRLRPEMFGPAVKPAVPAEAMAGRNKDDKVKRPTEDRPDQWRRSIYLFVKRSIPTPLLETFDAASPSACTGRRTVSTVATQALALLNDSWVRHQAQLFAQRLQADTDGTPPAEIRRAYLLAFGRPPTAGERAAAAQFLHGQERTHGLVNLCHVLLTLNEFIYVG